MKAAVPDFDGVLAHHNEIVVRARSQAGNLAHALKTPLSVLANAAHSRHDDPWRTMTERLALARRQIDHHLAQAQVAGSKLRKMRRIHAGRAFALQVSVVPEALAFRVKCRIWRSAATCSTTPASGRRGGVCG